MTVGVLALQGDFAEHIRTLERIGVQATPVRTALDLEQCTSLIIPGGESTVISKLMQTEGLFDVITSRYSAGTLPIFGTCAGAILLAKGIVGDKGMQTLGLMDITIDRNAYGTQHDSFVAEIEVEGVGAKQVSFIRAPKISEVSDSVVVLAVHDGNPVLVKQGDLLAATFHTETGDDTWLHKMFCL